MTDTTTNIPNLKPCGSGDECVHPIGPDLPPTTEYFYFSQYGKPRKFCKECAKSYRKKHHIANRDHDNQRSRDYIKANKETVYTKRRKYQAENKEELQHKASEKYHSDPATRAVRLVHAHNKRAVEYEVAGRITVEDYLGKLEDQDGKCWYCGIGIRNDWHTDHQIPMARGGDNTPENIVLCCARCNQKKHHKLPEEWEDNPRK